MAGAAAGGVSIAALAGFGIGALLGPFGGAVAAAIGAAVGAFGGSYGGRELAEAVNPSTEEHYWRSHFATRPYVHPGDRFDDFREAYAFGALTRREHPTVTFNEAEASLHAQ